jgi:hypothetical protein
VPVDKLETDALRAFGFLQSEFGCELERSEGARHSRKLAYRSSTGFADVHLDEPDQAVAVYFGATGQEAIPLWAVLDARGEPQPDPETDLDAWADALRRHGAPALRGDERQVSERIEQAREERSREGPLRSRLRRLWGRIP